MPVDAGYPDVVRFLRDYSGAPVGSLFRVKADGKFELVNLRHVRESITVEAISITQALADTLNNIPKTDWPITAYQVNAAGIASPRISPANFTLGGTGNKTITWLGAVVPLLLTDSLYFDYWTEE